jgi:hypothetical protein
MLSVDGAGVAAAPLTGEVAIPTWVCANADAEKTRAKS